jgi:hypothetical protein
VQPIQISKVLIYKYFSKFVAGRGILGYGGLELLQNCIQVLRTQRHIHYNIYYTRLTSAFINVGKYMSLNTLIYVRVKKKGN